MMADNTKVMEKFYAIQNSWQFEFHGVKMNRVMMLEFLFLSQTGQLGTPGKFLRIPFHTWDLSKLNFAAPNYILSTFGQQNRMDHKEVYDYVVAQLGDAVAYNDLNLLPRSIKVRPWLIMKVVFSSMKALRQCEVLTYKQKILLSFAACTYCNALLDLERIPLDGVRKYLSMYQSNQLENLITQYMKLNNIPTYSLCEGVYVVDREHPTIDMINYTNMETDHLLVWGQYVIDAFMKEGISASRMTIGGYPHPVKVEPMHKDNTFRSCFVLLARRDFMDADMRLLKILSYYSDGYKFYLKPHPNSDYETFAEYAKEHNMEMIPQTMKVHECMTNGKFDWAIAVNTTAYYEAYMHGVPCLRYNDESYLLLPGGNDCFKDKVQLDECIQYIKKNLATDKYQEKVNDMLEYVMGVGINRYKEILLEN